MSGFLQVILQGIFLKVIREKVRQGSLHAVRLYIGLVQQARLVSIAAVGVTTMAAAVLLGFAFIIGGVIFLLPIDKEYIPYVFIGLGCVAVLAGSLSLRKVFKEQHWMEMSEAYTLMDKAMALGGEPQATKRGDSAKATIQKSFAEMRAQQA